MNKVKVIRFYDLSVMYEGNMEINHKNMNWLVDMIQNMSKEEETSYQVLIDDVMFKSPLSCIYFYWEDSHAGFLVRRFNRKIRIAIEDGN